MTVIRLADEREKRSPHWAGECKCIGCGHRWVGVAPLGTMFVECPSCGLSKGHPYHPFGAGEAGDVVFKCNCGSEAMTAYYRGGRFRFQCMSCGADQTEAVFGE